MKQKQEILIAGIHEIEELEKGLSTRSDPPRLKFLGIILFSVLIAWAFFYGFNYIVLAVCVIGTLLIYTALFVYHEWRLKKIAERRVLEAFTTYRIYLKRLSLEPENLELEEQTLSAGRYYVSLCRNASRQPVLNENRMHKDIDAARAAIFPAAPSPPDPSADESLIPISESTD
jgi:hypothetical protein